MAEQSLLNQGVPFAASGTGVNLYGGVQRELARADEKKRQDEERAFKLASMIKQADSSQLFGRHYAIANKWASELYNNINRYTSSTQGAMDFLAQANALKGYIDGKKQYKSANMGDPSDAPNGNSYFSYINRTRAGGNPYANIDKKEVPKDMDAILKSYNDQTIVSFEIGPDGMPVVDLGAGPMTLVEANQLDVDAPFMADLVEDLDMLSPGEWYEQLVGSRGKGIKDANRSAAGRVFIDKLEQGRVDPRRLMNWWKTQGTRAEQEVKSQKTIDELLEDPKVVEAAAMAFAGGVEQKWDDLYKQEEEANAMKMFGTGQAALMDRDGNLIGRTFTGQTDATDIFDLLGAPTDDQLGSGEYNENWYDALGELETERAPGKSPRKDGTDPGLYRIAGMNVEELGFTNLMMFNSDEDNDFVVTVDEAPDLGRDEVIDAVNVDSRGNIYARVISTEDETYDDGSIKVDLDGKPIPKEVRDIRVYRPDDANNAMFVSLQDHINQGNAQQYRAMMENSADAAKAARRARVKLKIEAARARADEAAAAGTADPATTPEAADANADATPPASREEAPPVVEADREALSAISNRLADAGQQPGTETTVPRLIKMPDGVPRSNHFNDASESLLSQNYSHREIVAAFNDPRFSEALIESGYDGDERKDSRGPGGGLVDAFGGWSGHRFFKGMKSDYTKEVDKVEAALKSIMDDRATTQAASGPIDPEPIDPIVTDEAPTAEAPTERDFSGLPEISNVSASASRGVALSEGYSSDKSINVPGGNSGVTVGGIDLGSVAGNEDIKLKILKPFVSQEDYKALEGLAGLIGDEAIAGLEAAQNKGLLDPKTLISSDADLQSIISYGIESFVLPSIYKRVPKEEFDSLPSAVTDVLINVQFMTPGEEVLKAAVKANNKDKKSAWLKVADLYYKPVVERDSMEQEKDDLLKYTDKDDLLSVDAPYKSTYYGDAKKTDTKLDNYKNKKEGKKILPGNVKRVLEARWQLLDWINSKYGNE